jgi:hypothetical protein
MSANGFAVRIMAISLLSGFASRLPAQGSTSLIVLERAASARALALGDATVAIPDRDASLFTNPALLATMRRASGSISGQHYLADASLASASGAAAAFGGTLGIGLRGLDYGSVAEVVPDTVNFGGQRGVSTGRDVSATEFALSVGYGRSLHRVLLGASASYARQQIADLTGGVASFDVGIATTLAHGLVVAGAVQQLGGPLRLASTASKQPRVFRAGASLPLVRGSFGALVSGEGVVRREGAVQPRGGMEVSWRTANGIRLVARGGLHGGHWDDLFSHAAYGAGIAGAHMTLDYAYQGMRTMGSATHRVGIRVER